MAACSPTGKLETGREPRRVSRVPRQRGHAIGGQPREGHVAAAKRGRESHVVGQRPDSRGLTLRPASRGSTNLETRTGTSRKAAGE